MTEFVHLHVHSYFSLFESTIHPRDLIERVAAKGMTAVAVTDHGNLLGLPALTHLGRWEGVKVIPGAEVLLHPAMGTELEARRLHLVLLAETAQGLTNLQAQRILHATGTKNPSMFTAGCHQVTAAHTLKTPTEMAELFSDLPEAVANTVHIASACRAGLLEPSRPAPAGRPTPRDQERNNLLRHKAQDGLRRRIDETTTDGPGARPRRCWRSSRSRSKAGGGGKAHRRRSPPCGRSPTRSTCSTTTTCCATATRPSTCRESTKNAMKKCGVTFLILYCD